MNIGKMLGPVLVAVLVFCGVRLLFMNRNNSIPPFKPNYEIKMIVVQNPDSGDGAPLTGTRLRRVEQQMVEFIRLSVKESLRKSLRVNNPIINIESSSQELYTSPVPLVLIRIKASSIIETEKPVFTFVAVAGVDQGQMKSVVCGWMAPDTIPIASGECGDKIFEVFRTRVPG